MSSNEVLGQAADAVRRVGAAEAVSDVALADEVAGLRRLADVAEAAYVRKLRMFDARGVSEIQEVLSTRQWARRHFQVAAGETARVLRIAKVLVRLPVVEAALLAGSIRMPHAVAIVDAAAVVGVEVIAACQDALVAAARVNDPARLRAALRGLGLAIESRNARKRAERHDQDRWLDVAATFDGAVSVEGMFDAETGAIVQAAVDAASKPTGAGDRRTAAQRRADALVDICRGLARTPPPSTSGPAENGAGRSHGGDSDHDTVMSDSADDGLAGRAATANTGATGAFGQTLNPDHGTNASAGQPAGGRECVCGGRGARPSITVVCDLATLTSQTGGYGELPNGQILAGDAVRRLACDTTITRIITGPASQPLDVGRAQRTVTTAQLKALRVRDGGCRFPGCDRPAEWTDAHHIIWWSNGGTTTVEKMILLCRKHHTAVHEGGWAIHTTNTGAFKFINPAGLLINDPAARTTRPIINRLLTSVHNNP